MEDGMKLDLFRDVQTAVDINTMAALGAFPKEIVVYGIVYWADHKRQYMLSREPEKLIAFLNQPEHLAWFPTEIQRYSERLLIPDGYEETVVRRVKLALAGKLQALYPEELFHLLERYSPKQSDDRMEQSFLRVRRKLEALFAKEKLAAFRHILIRAQLQKHISQATYEKLLLWSEKRLAELAKYVPPETNRDRVFFGFAAYDRGEIHSCCMNANRKSLYDDQLRLEKEGYFLTGWTEMAFTIEKQESLQGRKQIMETSLRELYAGELGTLMGELEGCPSVLDDATIAQFRTEAGKYGEHARALAEHYLREWGVSSKGVK